MPDTPDSSKLDALVSLLADESPRVREECQRHARELGALALPRLRQAAREEMSGSLRSAARELAAEIAFEAGLAELVAARARSEPILEHGVLLLARLSDPIAPEGTLPDRLDLHATILKSRLGPGAALEAAVESIARYVHGDLGVRGNRKNYSDPRNSFLNQVLERRLGIPISIGALYLLLARRVGIPLHGINVPAHFLLGYQHDGDWVFVDTFHNGSLLQREQVMEATRREGFEWDPDPLLPATDAEMIVRMTNNLRELLAHDDPNGWLDRVNDLRRTLLGNPSDV